MKKVSTGERIKFADLRRRSVGGPRGDADSDVMSEQRFVSELMDTTPSSSYEGDLREGLPYNAHDASVSDSPLPRYDSDGEAADEVVTGTQDGVSKTDLIVKEDVPEIPGETQQGSLLAAELAAVKISASQPNQPASSRQRNDTHSDGESLMGDLRLDHGAGGCTADQLIRSLISECKALELGSDLIQTPDMYELRMADEDWDPDLDFPGLDSCAVITDVGVDQFVLCHQAKIEPMLHVTIVLHKSLNGPLTGTGAMEAPGAGATMTLEVNFRIPGQEESHNMSIRIAHDSNQKDLVRSRDSGSRSAAASAAVSEVEEITRMESGGQEKQPGPEGIVEKTGAEEKHPAQEPTAEKETVKGQEKQPGPEGIVEKTGAEEKHPAQEPTAEKETVKLRNIDTGEDIELAEIDERVPPSLDPGELFAKDVS